MVPCIFCVSPDFMCFADGCMYVFGILMIVCVLLMVACMFLLSPDCMHFVGGCMHVVALS